MITVERRIGDPAEGGAASDGDREYRRRGGKGEWGSLPSTLPLPSGADFPAGRWMHPHTAALSLARIAAHG